MPFKSGRSACVDPGDLPHLSDKKRGGPVSPLLFAIQCGDYNTGFFLLDKNVRLSVEGNIEALCSTPCFPSSLADLLKSKMIHERGCIDMPSNSVL
eukprot:10223379-Ditylum_brightwellii.AAC.1